MFSRGISVDEVEECIKMGNKIKEYLEDKPYPSFLILYFMNEKPIHIVVSQDISSGICYIITAYLPDQMLWDSDFKNKR
jgi:hypothetical protein